MVAYAKARAAADTQYANALAAAARKCAGHRSADSAGASTGAGAGLDGGAFESLDAALTLEAKRAAKEARRRMRWAQWVYQRAIVVR